MSADDDIQRPMLPAAQEEERERRGFFSRFTTKKQPKESPEVTLLKEHIQADQPKQSIQKDFEEHVAQEEEAPAPPPETLTEEPEAPAPEVQEEEAPAPPITIQKAEREEAPSIKDLEDELKALKEPTPKDHLITFTIMGGKRAVTLPDLKKVIQQMTPDQYEQRRADKEFSLWIKTHLFDNDLAARLQGAVTRQQALDVIEEELKPRIQFPVSPEPPKKHEDHVEEHFSKLQATHQKTMQELADAVKQAATPSTKDYLKEALKTKDGKVVESLDELAQAVSLLSDETYRNMLATRKEDFVEHLKRLAQQASRVNTLNPAQLQASIVEIIRQQADQINKAILQEKQLVADQAGQLLKKEDEIVKQEHVISDTVETIKQARQRVTEQREAWEHDVQAREASLQEKEQAVNDLIARQEEAIANLKQDLETREQALQDKERSLEEKRQQLRQDELGIAEKKRRELKDVEEEKRRLEERKEEMDSLEADLRAKEDQLAQDKQTFEEAMQKREQVVQDTVDKIIDIDEDINNQRENIMDMKRELDNEGFKKYLQHALRGVNTDHITFKALPGDEDLKKKYMNIYTRIDACNDAIENRKLQEAKRIYAELKQAFERETLTQDEKDILYDAIREIYANLHLALLEDKG